MDLKTLIGEELYAKVDEAISAHNAKEPDKLKHVRFVDLSEGGYVSRSKFDDTVDRLNQQVTGLQGQIAQRDTDMADLNAKLTAAQNDAAKLSEAQQALNSMQSKYDADKKDWEAKTAKQAYEFAVKTEAGKLKFSSAAARRDFIRGAIDAGFQMDGETIVGFTDYVNKYKTDDPAAFEAEKAEPTQTEPGAKPPTIVLPGNPAPPDKAVFGFHFNGVRPMPKE